MSVTSLSLSSSKILASLFLASNEARPVLLLGAGASFRSGIPVAAEAVKRIAKAAYIKQVLGGKNPSQVKVSDWMSWLTRQEWFIQGEERLAENFPLAVQHLLKPDEFRREVMLELMQTSNISQGYHHLGALMMRGLVHTVMTTNFDQCLPMALQAQKPHIKHFSQVNRGHNDFAEFGVNRRNQIVWLHGSAEQYTDRNLPEEVTHLNPDLVSRLRPLLDDSPILVIGYRGAELSVMDDLFIAGINSSLNYRRGVYWCTRKGEALHPHVERLKAVIGRNFNLIEIDGFDELMAELAVELKEEDLYPNNQLSVVPNSKVAFDERPMAEVRFEDLDQGLILSVLTQYCHTVGRAAVTPESLIPLMKELGLLYPESEKGIPTVGCCLLFGKTLPESLKYAAVSVTRGGKNRKIISGNLIQQLRELQELLNSDDLNPKLKIKGQQSYTERTTYPARCLTEMVVNLLVHRDYEVPELAEVNIEVGHSIKFINAGKIGTEGHNRIIIEEDGRIKPVRAVSQIRNPSIADVFFGIRTMEKLGTGLVDAEEEMLQAGGEAVYTIEKKSGVFRAILFQALNSASGAVRPLTPMGFYILNSLPIAVIPDTITVARLRSKASFFDNSTTNLTGLPVFIVRGDELISFASANVINEKFLDKIDSSKTEELRREDFESDAEKRKIVSWLIKKHWEFYLRRFSNNGLFIDPKQNRAYFRRLGTQKNIIQYSSPKKKNIKREVVKERGEKIKWHENEGIGYQVVFLDNKWAIRIKPFYMFTGSDGITPLPGFLRTKRATRRMKLDRNRNVDDDLTFWSRFLSGSTPTINIGGEGIDNLVIDSAFLTVEVPEIRSEEPNENSNRKPA